MKKKLVLTLLAILTILITITFNYGYTTEKEEEFWVHSTDSIDFNGEVFEIYHDHESNNESLIIITNNELLTLRLSECREYNQYKICLEDKNENDIKIIDGYVEPAYKLVFYSLNPEIEVSVSLKNSTTYVSEENEIKIMIENQEQEKNIEKFNLEFELPKEVEIRKVEGAVRVGKKIKVQIPTLYKREKRELKVVFVPKESIDKKITVFYNFDFLGKHYEKNIPNINIKTEKLYEFEVNYNNNAINIYDSKNVNVLLKNKGTLKISNAILIIRYEEGKVKIKSKDLIKSGIGTYFKEFSLDSGENFSLDFDIESLKTGNQKVTVEINITFENNENYYEKKDITFNVNSPFFDLKLFTSHDEITEGQSIESKVRVSYSYAKLIVDRVEIQFVKDNFENKTYVLEDLQPGKSVDVLREIVTFPLNDKTTEYVLKAKLKGYLVNGEIIEKEVEKKVKVYVSNESIVINKEVETSDDEEGKEVLVRVSVKNNVEKGLQKVIAQEILPEGINILSGQIKKNIAIFPSKETYQVYVYKIKIPKDFQGNNVSLITKLSYELDGKKYEKEKAIVIEVGNKNVEESNNQNQSVESPNDGSKNQTTNKAQNQNNAQGNARNNEEKQENIFVSILRSISKFFSTIFS